MGTEQATGTITGLLGNIVDDTMHFVDDLLARAHDLEVDTRGAVSNLVDVDRGDGGGGRQTQDAENLQHALTELQSKMDQLNQMRGTTSA